MLHLIVLSICVQMEVCLSVCLFVCLFVCRLRLNMASQGTSTLVRTFTNEEQRNIGSWFISLFDIFAANGSLVYDVTDTNCLAQNGGRLLRAELS